MTNRFIINDRSASDRIRLRRNPSHTMALLIGTSGWSYTGKGTWNGLFYPATRSKRDGTRDFDELRFYADILDTVEVNSTFYGQPRARGRSHLGRADASRLDFSVKLCRSSRIHRCSGMRH